jgi:hypothetical protein
MIRKLAVTLAAAIALTLPEVASAWTFSVSGSARCDAQSGQYIVVWTVDNSGEREPFSFNGGVAPAYGSATVTETHPGTATSASTTITGGWPSDRGPHSRSANVSMAGNCVTPPPPPVDQCPNIDGVQETVPPGMIKDASGNCVTPPPPPPPMSDDCPNLSGIQGSVPEGMIKDANGDCVPRPATSTTTTTTTTTAAPAALVQQGAAASPPAQPAAAPLAPAQPAATPPVTSGVKAEVKTKTKGKQQAAKKVKKAKKVKAKKAKSKRARGGVLPITK